MTVGEALAIIQMLQSCDKEISFQNIKKVAKAIGIKVTDGMQKHLEKIIQERLEILREAGEQSGLLSREGGLESEIYHAHCRTKTHT